jgi:hypothetical protein
MKSTVTFQQYFFEDMSVGDALGGAAIFSPSGNINSNDNIYAPGNARVPKLLTRGVQTRGGVLGRGKKKRKKKLRKRNKK